MYIYIYTYVYTHHIYVYPKIYNKQNNLLFSCFWEFSNFLSKVALKIHITVVPDHAPSPLAPVKVGHQQYQQICPILNILIAK